MNLKELINSRNLQTETASRIALELNEKKIEKRREERIGWRTVALISEPLAAAISLGLKGAIASLQAKGGVENIVMAELLDSALASYKSSDGLNFSEPKLQAIIELLTAAGAWDKETGNAIKSLGVWHVSPAEDNGIGVVTEEHAAAALIEIAEDVAIVKHSQLVAEIVNEVLNPGRFTTMEELKKAVASYKA